MRTAEKMQEPPPNAIARAGLASGARGTERDTNPTNCSTRVEFDNYKASYLRM